MIIDTHIHIFADNIAEAAASKLKDIAKIPTYTDFTEAGTRKKLREWGIDYGVVLPIATKPSQQHTINNWAKSVQHDNLLSFGTVHPFADDVLDELDYIATLGLLGIKFHPDYQEFFVDDEHVYPIYEKICALELPVAFHVGFDPLSPGLSHATPQRIAKIHALFPQMKIIAAHMGGLSMYDEVENYLLGQDIYIDISMSPISCKPEQFNRIVSSHSIERVLFASDCPWGLPADVLTMLENANLTADNMDNILYKNAINLFNLNI